ncbi:hypothetical protein ANN_05944 [Periplaneta americana]|uniref:Uncharacterized protein n=1 Tax=Periplaneta americana TaxID=6978 RepID=A0ABQ8TE82_PERAM|nr:hypothetical protein ANN_05944 [Periplaneta americana]
MSNNSMANRIFEFLLKIPSFITNSIDAITSADDKSGFLPRQQSECQVRGFVVFCVLPFMMPPAKFLKVVAFCLRQIRTLCRKCGYQVSVELVINSAACEWNQRVTDIFTFSSFAKTLTGGQEFLEGKKSGNLLAGCASYLHYISDILIPYSWRNNQKNPNQVITPNGNRTYDQALLRTRPILELLMIRFSPERLFTRFQSETSGYLRLMPRRLYVCCGADIHFPLSIPLIGSDFLTADRMMKAS